jgi:hypothetical protein
MFTVFFSVCPDSCEDEAGVLAAYTSAGRATGSTIAAVSIRHIIILTMERMIMLFISENVLFFISSGPSLLSLHTLRIAGQGSR